MDSVCKYIRSPSGPCCLKAGKFEVIFEENGKQIKVLIFFFGWGGGGGETGD